MRQGSAIGRDILKIHVVLTDKAISWIKACRKKRFLGQEDLRERSCVRDDQ